jgi:hypothetical protein
MGQKGVSMETKYAAMFASVRQGRETVTAVCARVGISRTSYYTYRSRFEAEGLEGLRPRCRRPHHSPTKTPPEMVELIKQAREALAREGWDNGAVSIRYRLLRDGADPPAWRTIHRVLVREQLVVPQPQKRPRSSLRRFEFPATDDCWQIDAFDYELVGGELATIFETKDDCSRTQTANLAWPAEETTGAWECLARGIDDFGLPLLLLSDNSLAFTGKHHRRMVLVERNLADLGIKQISSRPRHPQTCGKSERGHQTLQQWLRAQPQAHTLAELQTLLDRYQVEYNNRPHQGLDPNQTPLERRVAAARHTPRPVGPVPPATIVRHCSVKPRGFISWDGYRIGIGKQLAGRTLLVFATGDHLLIFYRHHLVLELDLDRSRRYQSRPEPRRRDANRDRLLTELLIDEAPRGNRAGPSLPPAAAPGAAEAPGSRAAAGRRAANAQRPLRPEKRPRTMRGAYPHPKTQLSAMS